MESVLTTTGKIHISLDRYVLLLLLSRAMEGLIQRGVAWDVHYNDGQE